MEIQKVKLPFKFMNMQALLIAIVLLLFSSCTPEVKERFQAPKTAFGMANHVVVVVDDELWNTDLGDTIRYYFASAYPILPQPEPFFDLKHFSPSDLDADPVRKELRTYLIIGNLGDQNSSTTNMITTDMGAEKTRRAKEQNDYNITLGYDKWANGQLLVYLFAQSQDELINVIKRHFPAISKRINKSDEKQFEATVYFGGENQELKNKLKKSTGVNMRVPSDYTLAIQDGSTVWLRKDTDDLISNIIVHKMKYTDQTQLSKEGLKKVRDELGKKYVSTEIEDTYMRTNDVDLPMITHPVNLNGNYAVEARGIWDIVNDYMGGPFLSYMIHNEKDGELVFIDGFIHAPGKKKRNFMQQVEYVIKSAAF